MLAYKKEIELDLSDSYTSEVACFLSRTSRHETPAQPTKRAGLFCCHQAISGYRRDMLGYVSKSVSDFPLTSLFRQAFSRKKLASDRM